MKNNQQDTLIKYLEKLYPISKQEPWDFCGFSLLFKSNEKFKVLVAFEINQNVIDYAINNQVTLIVSYHPFLFAESWEEYYLKDPTKKAWVEQLSEHKISVYGIHTCFDANRRQGMCKLFVDQLKFNESKVTYLDYCFLYEYNNDFDSLVNETKIAFNLTGAVTNVKENIKLNKVMFFPGSGNIFDFIEINQKIKVDLLITSDIKWNDQQLLNSLGYKYLMISHHSENVFVDYMHKKITSEFNDEFEVISYKEPDFNLYLK